MPFGLYLHFPFCRNHCSYCDFYKELFEPHREKQFYEALRVETELCAEEYAHQDNEISTIFVGGGTGFAPLKGMIEHAMHRGIRRPMHLYWGVRSRRDIYLPALPERWARDWPDFTYTPVLSEPDPDWSGRIGFVHEAVVADHPDMRGFDIYMSGPPAMVEAGRLTCEARGATMDHMFSDAFTYAKDDNGPRADGPP